MGPVTPERVREVFAAACTADSSHHPIPLGNAQALRDFVMLTSLGPNDFISVRYNKGDELVHTGRITDPALQVDAKLAYAYVPLGFIVRGEVIVLKGSKATKQLGEGDFLGLFETADWITTGRTREIGDWTLIANSDVEVLYFAQSVLEGDADERKQLREYLVELARADHVPKPLTSLPLLDWVADHVTDQRLHECVIIMYTHMLPNSFPLFRHLSSIVDFGKIYAVEKPYSTTKQTLNQLVWAGFEVIPVHIEPGLPYEFAVQKSVAILWQKVLEDRKHTQFKNLLIVDDGADILQTIPWDALSDVRIAGVQQTARGTTRIVDSPFRLPPIVNIASSGVKKVVESKFIGKSVVETLASQHILDGKRVGILGMGSIGTEVDIALLAHGIEATFYDPKYPPGSTLPPRAQPSIDTLLNACDVVIGTTGSDTLKGIPYERISGHKVLVSASSQNIEFRSLSTFADPVVDPFGTIRVTLHASLSFDILNGGYPINFNRVTDSTPDEDIVLTRSMLYVGTIQAASLITSGQLEPKIYALDKVAQAKLLERWIADKRTRGQDPGITEADIPEIIAYKSIENAVDMPSVWHD